MIFKKSITTKNGGHSMNTVEQNNNQIDLNSMPTTNFDKEETSVKTIFTDLADLAKDLASVDRTISAIRLAHRDKMTHKQKQEMDGVLVSLEHLVKDFKEVNSYFANAAKDKEYLSDGEDFLTYIDIQQSISKIREKSARLGAIALLELEPKMADLQQQLNALNNL